MRIGLLGATGPTGLRLVQQALDAGHQVIALVRNPDKLAHIEHEGLSKIKVDIFSADDLQKAFTENKVEVSHEKLLIVSEIHFALSEKLGESFDKF